jgi:hypothetical protein
MICLKVVEEELVAMEQQEPLVLLGREVQLVLQELQVVKVALVLLVLQGDKVQQDQLVQLV